MGLLTRKEAAESESARSRDAVQPRVRDHETPPPLAHEPLPVGQRIYCSLNGGKTGVLFRIHGEQQPSSARQIMGGVGVTGGNANFDIVWERGTQSLRTAEALVRASVQWKLLPGIADQDEIDELLRASEAHLAAFEAEQRAAAAQFAAEKNRIINDNPDLKPLLSGQICDSKLAAQNLRIELKKAFPKFKFSVTSQGSINVRWVDGPTGFVVHEITKKYQYNATPWNKAFGSSDYVFTGREFSDTLMESMLDHLYAAIPGNMKEIARRPVREMMSARLLIPNVEITVSEALNSLASAWDGIAGEFVDHRTADQYVYRKHSWLIESAIDAMKAEHENAPAPSM